MSPQDRAREIQRHIAHIARDVLVLRLTEETLRLTVTLNDGTTLRVTERWHNNTLIRYSYYWLDAQNTLKTGWDNAPHHKHIGTQSTLAPSTKTSLEDIIPLLA